MVERRDLIRSVLAAFPRVFREPTIPVKKHVNAREQCRVPETEEILGLIDCTIFGSAKHAVVFGQDRIYIRDSWTDDKVVVHRYSEIRKLEARIELGREKTTHPTTDVLAALRAAIDRMHEDRVRAAFVPATADENDITTSPEATALEAEVFAAPADEGPQLVLADLLLAADDPRGELIVLHNRETADPTRTGGLVEPEALERYLLLAAHYGFPQASPEPPALPWAASLYSVSHTVIHDARQFTVAYRRSTVTVYEGSRTVLERRLRTSDNHEWTPVEAATILRTIGDAIVAGTPLKSLRFPYTDDELPSYPGCALRVYALPREFTKPRGIAHNRLGLAARDYDRWITTWRRLARTLATRAA